MKKNNFNKIMQNNLDENYNFDTYSRYQEQYRKMYGVQNKNDYEREQTKNKAERDEQARRDKESQKEEIRHNYFADVDDIKDEYLNQTDNLNLQIARCNNILNDLGPDYDTPKAKAIIEKFKNSKRNIENSFNVIKKMYDNKLKRVAMKLRREDIDIIGRQNIIKSVDNLDLPDDLVGGFRLLPTQQEFTFGQELTEADLSVFEQNLIFGSLLETIQESIEINEAADPNRERRLALKDAAEAASKANATKDGIIKAKLNATATQLNHTAASLAAKANDDIRASAEEKASGILGEAVVYPERSPQVVNAEKRLEQMKERNDKAEARQRQNIERIRDSVRRQKINQQQTDATTATLTEESEDYKIDERRDRIDFNNFSKTLFDGAFGNALRYLIKGEINNTNITDVSIAKYMKDKPEVEAVLKKIRFYLRKTTSGLSYEEYIDLKVQKGKFRTLFTQAKKEYQTRYK